MKRVNARFYFRPFFQSFLFDLSALAYLTWPKRTAVYCLGAISEREGRMLKEGDKAPAFRLEAADGKTVSLGAFSGKTVVLYFYPKDLTPGCTLEAQAFRDAAPALARKNAVVLGVSRDSVASHCKFRDKCDLNFPLLSDPDGNVVEKYGAWGEKNLYGKKTMGIIRTTVVIGPDGRIKKIFPKVKVAGHAEAVLAAI
jgi:peroxiredoxin Q/BCP